MDPMAFLYSNTGMYGMPGMGMGMPYMGMGQKSGGGQQQSPFNFPTQYGWFPGAEGLVDVQSQFNEWFDFWDGFYKYMDTGQDSAIAGDNGATDAAAAAAGVTPQQPVVAPETGQQTTTPNVNPSLPEIPKPGGGGGGATASADSNSSGSYKDILGGGSVAGSAM